MAPAPSKESHEYKEHVFFPALPLCRADSPCAERLPPCIWQRCVDAASPPPGRPPAILATLISFSTPSNGAIATCPGIQGGCAVGVCRRKANTPPTNAVHNEPQGLLRISHGAKSGGAEEPAATRLCSATSCLQ